MGERGALEAAGGSSALPSGAPPYVPLEEWVLSTDAQGGGRGPSPLSVGVGVASTGDTPLTGPRVTLVVVVIEAVGGALGAALFPRAG